jgi:hypothetical protein
MELCRHRVAKPKRDEHKVYNSSIFSEYLYVEGSVLSSAGLGNTQSECSNISKLCECKTY